MSPEAPGLGDEDHVRLDRLERSLHLSSTSRPINSARSKRKPSMPRTSTRCSRLSRIRRRTMAAEAPQVVPAPTPVHEGRILRQLEIVEFVDIEEVIRLAHMVVDHVQNHGKSRCDARRSPARRTPGTGRLARIRPVARFRREVIHRHIAPVIFRLRFTLSNSWIGCSSTAFTPKPLQVDTAGARPTRVRPAKPALPSLTRMGALATRSRTWASTTTRSCHWGVLKLSGCRLI